MAENRTPSDIAINEDTNHKYDSHESLGFKRASGSSYSLARSPTPSELAPMPVARPEPPSAIGDTSVNSIGVPNSSVTYISGFPSALEENLRTDTTRVLEGAVDQEQLGSQLALSSVPPLSARSRQFGEHAAHLQDPARVYAQVLVWCLQRRIDQLQRSPPKELTTSRHFVVKKVLETLESKLIGGSVAPRWHTHQLLNLRPRMANPENEKSQEILHDLKEYRERLKASKLESARLLRKAEDAAPVDAPRAERVNAYLPVLVQAMQDIEDLIRELCANLVTTDALHANALEKTWEALGAQQGPALELAPAAGHSPESS